MTPALSVCCRSYARHRGVQRLGARGCLIRDAWWAGEIHCGAVKARRDKEQDLGQVVSRGCPASMQL
jgi:hypothetical protein